MARPNGGWISGYTAPAPAAARGVWSLRDNYPALQAATWPASLTLTTQLLLHFNGANNSTTFTDSGVASRTITRVGSPVISTAASYFGGASGSFPGSGSYLTVADADSLELGSRDFVIELFFQTSTSVALATLISKSSGGFGTGSWSLLMNIASGTAGDLGFYAADFSAGSPLLTQSAVNLRDGAWHHVVISRSGNTWGMYIDGTRRATRTQATTIANNTAVIVIGADVAASRPFTGNIDELRILVGTASQWTAATGTVPTVEY